MKKTLHTALTAAAFAAAMGTAANVNAANVKADGNYGFDPAAQEIQDVYGPAPDYWETETTADITQLTTTTTTTTMTVTLYGPPWAFTTTETTPVTQPPQPVYGPPIEYTTTTSEPPQLEYGPPIDYVGSDILGDVNDDGIVDVFDMITFRKQLTERYYKAGVRKLGDVNKDGDISISDLVRLQNYLLGKITSFEEEIETKPLTTTYKTTKIPITTTTAELTSYDPRTDLIIAMYGPPEYFNLDPESLRPILEDTTTTQTKKGRKDKVTTVSTTTTTSELQTETTTTYDPRNDRVPTVYGPPSMFGYKE